MSKLIAIIVLATVLSATGYAAAKAGGGGHGGGGHGQQCRVPAPMRLPTLPTVQLFS
jgi:hypothetical protein